MSKLHKYLNAEIEAIRANGIFNRPRVLETEQKATVIIDGHEVITLSSNNYLGLTVHPRLCKANLAKTLVTHTCSIDCRPQEPDLW